MSNAAAVVAIALALVVYFLPTIIAMRRQHANRWPIFAINLLFGGTGLGWIGALIWSLHAVHRGPDGWTGGQSGLNLSGADKTAAVQDVQSRPQSAKTSEYADLVQLKELHDSGAIDADEYETLRKPIVGRIAMRPR